MPAKKDTNTQSTEEADPRENDGSTADNPRADGSYGWPTETVIDTASVTEQPAHSPETQDYVESQLAPVLERLTALEEKTAIFDLMGEEIEGFEQTSDPLAPLFSAVKALRDAIVAQEEIVRHGSALLNSSKVRQVYADALDHIDDVLRAA